MNNKKTIMIAVAVLLLAIVATVGASYAYFATTSKTSGNDETLNITTEDLGSIKWEGTKVYTSGDLLPGECGIQTFTIEKNSTSGKGIYEVDLKGIIDSVFNEDVEITLYKSTDTSTNNVTIKEGSSTITGDTTKQYYKEDSIVLNGIPEKVYGTKALKNEDQIILEQADFDNSTLSKTTYYLVYCYKNNGNQDAQQGKSFSGEISVKLILEKGKVPLSDYVAETANDTALDEASNTRYIGSNPNNFVSIDGDIWRIIGTMKSIDDGIGNKEDRVKLIRASSIGKYSWDSSASGVNGGWGVNEWSQADVMKLLNPGYESETVGGSLYWNNASGKCYYSNNNGTTSCNFTSTGIKDNLKSLIGNAVWNIGSQGTNSSFLTKDLYAYERSSNTGKICTSGTYCNDDLERTTTWTGLVGLMYLSDYGYATSGGSTTDRTICLNTYLNSWNRYSECYKNDWLFNSFTQWSISSHAYSANAGNVFFVDVTGSISSYVAYRVFSVRPVVYLTSNVKISGGEGTSESPFTLSL